MRLPSIVAVLIACSLVSQSFGQWFPNAPWHQSGCYTDANGQTICPRAPARSAVRVTQSSAAVQAARYPSVGSAVVAQSPVVYYDSPVVSYGSTGGAAMSMSVTSMGSTGGVSVSQQTLAPDANEVSILARRSDFRKALMDAAKASREKGEITVAEYFKIAALSRIPKVLANLEASVHEAAIEEGIATVQAPDWGAIIDFIERLIPLIIKLIDLFSFNDSGLNEVQYVSAESYEGYLRWDSNFGLAT